MGIFDMAFGLLGNKKKDTGAASALIDPKKEFRTEEQEKAVFYFSPENVKPEDFRGCVEKVKGCFTNTIKGCFPKKEKKKAEGCFPKDKKGCFPKGRYISDEEYDVLVKDIVTRLDPKARGLQKLVLDDSQIEKEIVFANYAYRDFDDDADSSYYWKIGDDGRFRSSVYEVTYLFFTRDEIAAYKLILGSDWEKHDEQTSEYHYRDITAFSTKTLQKDIIKTDPKTAEKKKEYRTVQNVFQIIVPGDSFTVSLGNKPTSEEEDTIQGMKSLLREKKV